MMQLFIEPVDVWLFRDGRSFDAGNDHWAKSLFPPLPSVMQGIIRSHYLVVNKVSLTDQAQIRVAVGTDTDFKNFRLRGPVLMKEKVRYYPAPADARTVDRKTHALASLPPCTLQDKVQTSAPTSLLLIDEQPQKGETGLWLSEGELSKYLRGETVVGTPSNELFRREERFGIRQNNDRRVTEEGQLYEAEFIRPCADVGLWVEIEDFDNWPENGLLRMGGEGRGGYFEKLDKEELPLAQADQPLSSQFKLYFATPTYFAGGWQPENGDWSQYFTGPVTLQAAAVGRYQSIGGYDWAEHKHKPAYRYVPAGSVYYLRASNGLVSLGQNWVCDATPDGAPIGQIGFGQVIVAEWQSEPSKNIG